jgi:hypothetical protein
MNLYSKNTYVGVDVFLTSALVGGEKSASHFTLKGKP